MAAAASLRPVGAAISPHRFVALDTTAYTKYYRNVMAKGLINRFVIKYVDANRKKIKDRFKTDREFISGFEVTPQMLAECSTSSGNSQTRREWNTMPRRRRKAARCSAWFSKDL